MSGSSSFDEKTYALDHGYKANTFATVNSSSVAEEAGRPHFFIGESSGHGSFVGEQGGNGAQVTIQDVWGAPVEGKNPLGYSVGWWSALFLNITMLIGTGIFSFPSSLLRSLGSVGLTLVYWPIGLFISLAGISVYLEFTAYFPSRSGAEVVYLEQAYRKLRFFFPVAFAVQTVILSFVSSNAIVVAEYIFKMTDHTPSDWESKGVGIAALTIIILPVFLSTNISLRLSNILGTTKIITLIIIIIPGLVALGGHFKVVPDPTANFRNAFEGTTNNGYSLSNALVNIIFSYGGYTNSFNVVNEIKNPIRTIKYTANTAVIFVAVLYLLTNIAYFAVLTQEEIKGSTQVTATLFWEKLWGSKVSKGLTILPVLSASSNILNTIVGHSRMIREIGRQGVLPYPKFWATTWPIGTPTGALSAIWFVTLIVIVAVPAGNAFNFIVALQNYPSSFFLALMTLGLFIVRGDRRRLNLPRPEYRSYTIVVLFFLTANTFLIIMPWVPPTGGINNSSFGFFYAASSLTGLGIVFLCGFYYVVWSKFLPKWKGYKLRQTVITLSDGALTHKMVKVRNEDVDAWDATHDPSGRSLNEDEDVVEVKEETLGDLKEQRE
ncbi:high-affinity methionine permease [Cryptococcus neoformans Tu259-1]|uniref:High-affinity methionine permease n=1 Tax=Cryptococcus neoformans Tu259-1 TaxID=1230072 RepID=A0A854Q9J7_CRYNE|nr:high-affinity methionine permease [Cryptococcus neoformans var. grubii Tu259-1]